ncbi:cysteine rich repeat-containing protein [Ancylobacter sp. G4_0304]|uniref:cysteine rich repeat-containing protein n=1 Tax=Ancylobacter sp. G4_0304 TaxID=3114289 RepID=UPI0039C5B6D7
MDRTFFLRAGIVLAFATLLGATFAGAASAQNLPPAQAKAVRAACEADIRATCPGVQPGGGRILQCIKANPDKISQPCKDALVAAKAASAQ